MKTDTPGRLLWEHDEVRIPARQRPARPIDRPQPAGAVAFLSARPLEVMLAAGIAVGFGVVVAVITGNWWLLPLAAGVNALGTIGAAIAVIQIKAAGAMRWQPARSMREPARTGQPARMHSAVTLARKLRLEALGELKALLSPDRPQRSRTRRPSAQAPRRRSPTATRRVAGPGTR